MTPTTNSTSQTSSTRALLTQAWDILIIGTGAAALTTALSASTTCPDLRILLIEKAPQEWVGGNSYFTAGAYRTIHNGLSDLLPLVSNVDAETREKIDLAPYTEADFLGDLKRVTGGRTDEELGGLVVGESLEAVRWLKQVGGVEWWLSFRRQAYEVDGRWKFWGGLALTVRDGGKGLVKNLLDAVEKKTGVSIAFESKVQKLLVDEQGAVQGVDVNCKEELFQVRAGSVVMCAGGFEADPEMRKTFLGPGWELAHVRGTPYNTGDLLKAAMAIGAKRVGDFSPGGCHSVAWDANSPPNGGDREKTNEFTKSGYPLGLMLNAHGKRFVDEGVDLRNYTYAKFGRAILEQPKGIAFQVWDADAVVWLRDEEYRESIVKKIWADSLEELAKKCASEGLEEPEALVQTVEEYNAAVHAHREEFPNHKLDPAIKDGLSTQSRRKQLVLPKSNWALAVEKSPFLAVKVTSGITFTFGGLSVDPASANVRREDGARIEGLYCAGEMVGGLFYSNYPGGSGLTAGAVLGRRAGRAAAAEAQRRKQKSESESESGQV